MDDRMRGRVGESGREGERGWGEGLRVSEGESG